MMTLGLDTSEPRGGVALYDGDTVAEERTMSEPLRHAECLFPLIDRILGEYGLAKKQVDLVGVNCGPGSFTGLRIGVAAAKGFCQALDVPLTGVDGTVAYRRQLQDESRRVCVVIASRRDLFFVRWFSGTRPREEILMLNETQLVDKIRQEQRELTLIGSGAPRVYERVREHPFVRLEGRLDHPSPLSVAQVGASQGAKNRLFEVEPLYVEPVLG
jgi:tRNA threonylcarbamoyladenosine biosynthesis protein TsaB